MSYIRIYAFLNNKQRHPKQNILGYFLIFSFLCMFQYSYAKDKTVDCNIVYKSKDYENAIRICTKEMQNGSISATTKLAKIYLTGPKEYRNNKRAYSLLVKSSNKRDPDAMIELGNMYKIGVEPALKDLDKAAIWYKRSAIRGNPIGLVNLGIIYLDDAYEFRPNAAYVFFLLAKERGFESNAINKIMRDLEHYQNEESKEYIRKFKQDFESKYLIN